MTGLEQNADVVRMAAFAPMLTNVQHQPVGAPNTLVSFDNHRWAVFRAPWDAGCEEQMSGMLHALQPRRCTRHPCLLVPAWSMHARRHREPLAVQRGKASCLQHCLYAMPCEHQRLQLAECATPGVQPAEEPELQLSCMALLCRVAVSPSYHVQALFAQHAGPWLVPSSVNLSVISDVAVSATCSDAACTHLACKVPSRLLPQPSKCWCLPFACPDRVVR